MEIQELRYVCQEAALDLVRNEERPLPVTIVLPGPDRTRLVRLPDFPAEDQARHTFLAQFAEDEVTANQIPCWGFVAEAEIGDVDGVVVAYGARRHPPEITAAAYDDHGFLIEFEPAEELDPTALPFLHPLQHAVDSLPALEQPPSPEGEGANGDGLPIFPG